MMTIDWEVAKELFYRAIELEPERRAAFLDEACGDDGAVRGEVESLLESDEKANTFLAARPDLPLAFAGHDLISSIFGESTFAPTVVPLGGMRRTDPPVFVGSVLDGIYHVEALLGRGGMGAVYSARHAVLGDLVAVKVLSPHVGPDPVWLQRFVREGQAARSVRHPNLVLVYDLRTSADGVTYLVMERVEGRTLRERLREAGRLAPAEALEILDAVAGALDAAHAAGVVHRDLKPANIMLGTRPGQTVKVLDLGIAKLREEVGAEAATELTEAGRMVGTPAYMSPEQWGAVPRDGGLAIDGRSDVYSLGVVAYELLSGRLPFPGGTVEDLRRAHLRDEVPAVDCVEEVGAPTWAVIERALSKDRDDRPATAGAFATELREALGLASRGEPTRPSLAPPRAAGSGTRPAGLPEPMTSFVARDREVADVASQLRRDDVRMVTLTGTGGTGKTRLALRSAREMTSEFPDGVYLVELAAVADAALVLPAVARALGVKHEAPTPLLESLLRKLEVGRRLVVVDNVEHVLEAAPQLAALVAGAPGLKLLVTSRERLRVRAEHEYAVRPLELPVGEQEPADVGAVALFLERAREARPDFALTDENAQTVVEICRRLDGLPLAIELAAARLALLSPEALLARLDGQLTLLSGGPRDLPERQQTMRGAIAWSYDLLDADAKRVFERLALFVGDFTLDEVEAVFARGAHVGHPASSATEGGVLDAVASLLDKGLLARAEPVRADVRFRMLEVVREFARERLQASGGEAEAARRHAEGSRARPSRYVRPSVASPIPPTALSVGAASPRCAPRAASRESRLGSRRGAA